MAIILNFDTTTLEGLVATLVTKEGLNDTAQRLAQFQYNPPGNEPQATRRVANGLAAQTTNMDKQTALIALTAYIASII